MIEERPRGYHIKGRVVSRPSDDSLQGIIVVAGVTPVYLSLVPTGTDGVAKLVLGESLRE
jgi:hypothetical protein